MVGIIKSFLHQSCHLVTDHLSPNLKVV